MKAMLYDVMDTYLGYGIVEACVGVLDTKLWVVITFEDGVKDMGSKRGARSFRSTYFIF